MIDYKRLEKLLETCGGVGEWRYVYREDKPTVHTIEDDIVTIAQDESGIVGRDPDWELMAMAPGLAEEVLCMRDEAQSGYTSLVQGSLSLTSAEAIAVHAKAVSVLRKILAADRASEYAKALQDAGLLAPEPPKPSAEKSAANIAEWFPVPTDPHNPVVWTTPGGTVMVQRLEPGDLTPAEARSVALALIAAADYAERK